jgi:hypothetical protein
VDAQTREAVAVLRQTILSDGTESTPVKTAWLKMIDQALSDDPSQDRIFAAMAEVERLAPSGSKASSVNLI